MLITQHDCCKNKSVGFNFLFRNHYFCLYDYINCYTLLLKQWNRGSIFCFLLLTLLCCLSELTACFGCVGFVGCFILFQEELLKCCCGLGFNLSLLLALKEKKMTTSADNDSELRSLLNDLFVSPVCWDPCMYLFGHFFLRSIPCSSLDIGH